RGRTQVAHHRPQRRRLAGAVAPDETDQLARRRLQRNLSEDVAGLDEDVDVMHAQHGYWSGVREVAVHRGWPDLGATRLRAPLRRGDPQDRPHDVGIGTDRVGRGVGEHATLVEGDDAVGVAEDDVHVVLDLHDGAHAHAL